MPTPRELLETIGARDKVPVYINGNKFMCRTHLSVEDSSALTGGFFAENPIWQSGQLFRILGMAGNGMPLFDDAEDDAWFFANTDAVDIHKGMMDAGIYAGILKQLAAGKEAGKGEGKPQA